jgi:Origin recognition complex (ORC) subunit 4 C-terminus
VSQLNAVRRISRFFLVCVPYVVVQPSNNDFINKALPYPHVALLIAAAHEQTAGHESFNFETLHDKFVTQVRVSVSAPVHMERGGLGMVNVARGVLLGASVYHTVRISCD